MNERVMQFRIGMFVIVAGLVLSMLLVWFGESPSLLRDHVFVTARYVEAPGVAEGVPVRKSGIRVGEVTAVTFDEREGQPDGVLVTIQLERKYKLKAGSRPRITRSLIGDVSIDMIPGPGPELLQTFKSHNPPPTLEGEITPDPSKALQAATEAFQKAGNTLAAIDAAASGIADISKKAGSLGEFLDTWGTTGRKMMTLAEDIDRVVRDNEADIKPAVANLRQAVEKVNAVLDPSTQANAKSAINRMNKVTSELELGLAEVRPLLRDLGAPATTVPQTGAGQTVQRLNRIASDVGLLTHTLNDGKNGLNTNGTLQRMLTHPELFDNLNRMAATANEVINGAKPVVNSFRTFAEKLARDPSAMTRGALQRQ
ncbi:MlaD family protein [Isosphaeraceae bacterium EP7]